MKICMFPIAELTKIVLRLTSQFLLHFLLFHSHAANKYLLKTQYYPRAMLNILMIRRKPL